MRSEKEKREEAILLSLRKCDYLSREQLQKIHNLGQTRNAQRILSNMNQYLSFLIEAKKKVYYLNSAGRELIQAKKVRKKTAMINHYLMRNDLFILLGRPSTWKNEVKITIPQSNVNIISDAAFISNKIHHFIEIDHKQSMVKNVAKIKRYLQLSTYNPHFTLVWVTTTPYRKKRIESMCHGLRVKVYLWDEIQ
ncbi:replication-relaxation family protein [Neobacillus sp. NPDC058068]|uniref:replication-relaxation family protein n=1 Tax=Neobacillus sp. NPDC058068 TaxID=3346325 RepID=UPI0036D7E8DD